MPTIFIRFGYIFKFYSNEHGPIHVHVMKAGNKAKYSLFPVLLVENYGMKPPELKQIESIINDSQEEIAEYWNSFFNTR